MMKMLQNAAKLCSAAPIIATPDAENRCATELVITCEQLLPLMTSPEQSLSPAATQDQKNEEKIEQQINSYLESKEAGQQENPSAGGSNGDDERDTGTNASAADTTPANEFGTQPDGAFAEQFSKALANQSASPINKTLQQQLSNLDAIAKNKAKNGEGNNGVCFKNGADSALNKPCPQKSN